MKTTKMLGLMTLGGSLVFLSGCVGEPAAETDDGDAPEEESAEQEEAVPAPTTTARPLIMSIINKI